jgi:hypothetical protein
MTFLAMYGFNETITKVTRYLKEIRQFLISNHFVSPSRHIDCSDGGYLHLYSQSHIRPSQIDPVNYHRKSIPYRTRVRRGRKERTS